MHHLKYIARLRFTPLLYGFAFHCQPPHEFQATATATEAFFSFSSSFASSPSCTTLKAPPPYTHKSTQSVTSTTTSSSRCSRSRITASYDASAGHQHHLQRRFTRLVRSSSYASAGHQHGLPRGCCSHTSRPSPLAPDPCRTPQERWHGKAW